MFKFSIVYIHVCARYLQLTPLSFCGEIHVYPCFDLHLTLRSLQLWKRSGAWFFKGIPKYIVPSKKADSSAHSASSTASTRQNDRSTHVRTESKRIGQMKVAASKYNTWSHRQHLRSEPPSFLCVWYKQSWAVVKVSERFAVVITGILLEIEPVSFIKS